MPRDEPMGEAMLFLVDPAPVVAAGEMTQTKADPAMQPVVLPPMGALPSGDGDTEIVSNEIKWLKEDNELLKTKLAELENEMVSLGETVTKVHVVLLRKLGSLD